MSRLTKQAVLKGKDLRVEEPVPELGGFLVLRPVTDAEANEAKAHMLSRIKLPEGVTANDLADGKVTMDDQDLTGLLSGSQWQNYALVAAAIVDEEKWSPEDVAALPPGVPDRLAKKVSEISGRDGAVAAQSFRP